MHGPRSTGGCTVPPKGPGGFYPYWTQLQSGIGYCALEFGNVSGGFGLNTYGQDGQYGTDQFNEFGYPQFISHVYDNPCADPYSSF